MILNQSETNPSSQVLFLQSWTGLADCCSVCRPQARLILLSHKAGPLKVNVGFFHSALYTAPPLQSATKILLQGFWSFCMAVLCLVWQKLLSGCTVQDALCGLCGVNMSGRNCQQKSCGVCQVWLPPVEYNRRFWQ
jgi:hypothetical protein